MNGEIRPGGNRDDFHRVDHQILKLDSKGIKNLSNDAISKIGPETLKQMSGSQFKALGNRIQYLEPNSFAGLSKQHLDDLTAEQLSILKTEGRDSHINDLEIRTRVTLLKVTQGAINQVKNAPTMWRKFSALFLLLVIKINSQFLIKNQNLLEVQQFFAKWKKISEGVGKFFAFLSYFAVLPLIFDIVQSYRLRQLRQYYETTLLKKEKWGKYVTKNSQLSIDELREKIEKDEGRERR